MKIQKPEHLKSHQWWAHSPKICILSFKQNPRCISNGFQLCHFTDQPVFQLKNTNESCGSTTSTKEQPRPQSPYTSTPPSTSGENMKKVTTQVSPHPVLTSGTQLFQRQKQSFSRKHWPESHQCKCPVYSVCWFSSVPQKYTQTTVRDNKRLRKSSSIVFHKTTSLLIYSCAVQGEKVHFFLVPVSGSVVSQP